jgi:hypothetical protein
MHLYGLKVNQEVSRILSLLSQGLEPYSQHLFFLLILKWAQKARVFVPARPFRHSLIFDSETGACPSEASFQVLYSMVVSFPYPKTSD